MGDLIDLTDRNDAPTASAAVFGGAVDRTQLSHLYAEHNPAIARYLRLRVSRGGDALAARTWLVAARSIATAPADPLRLRDWLLGLAVVQARREQPSSWLFDDDRGITRLLGQVEFPADGGTDLAAPQTVTGDAATARLLEALSDEEGHLALLELAGGSPAGIATALGVPVQQVRAQSEQIERNLDDAFGRAECTKLLERATQTAWSPPPTGLLDAMVIAADPNGTTGRGMRTSTALVAKLAIAGGLVIATATGAAAATGTLPAIAQDSISSVAGHLGVDLPDSHDDETDEGDPTGDAELVDHSGTDVGPAGDAPASTHGAEVSTLAQDTDLEGRDKGQQIAETARGDNGPPDHVETGPPAEHETGPPADAAPAANSGRGQTTEAVDVTVPPAAEVTTPAVSSRGGGAQGDGGPGGAAPGRGSARGR